MIAPVFGEVNLWLRDAPLHLDANASTAGDAGQCNPEPWPVDDDLRAGEHVGQALSGEDVDPRFA